MEIKNTAVYGLEDSLIRSGYPMSVGDVPDMDTPKVEEADIKRGIKLGKVRTGTGHDNFLKSVIVQFDIKYPQYFTPQLQRYNWIDIISSQSKMHRLTQNKLSKDNCNKWVLKTNMGVMNELIDLYNSDIEYPYRYICSYTTNYPYSSRFTDIETKYDLFMTIVSNLPMGYEMWMGISTNYLQLKTIYQQRKNHKLHDDWGYFCKWVEGLPMFKELVLGKES